MSEHSISESIAVESHLNVKQPNYDKFKNQAAQEDGTIQNKDGKKNVIKQNTELSIRTQAFIDEEIDEESLIGGLDEA